MGHTKTALLADRCYRSFLCVHKMKALLGDMFVSSLAQMCYLWNTELLKMTFSIENQDKNK
jgi:hypothetical protein